jgi:hypothetical protein
VADPSTAEVPLVAELANMRIAIDRLERRASWNAVAHLLTLAVAAGAIALPFLVRRFEIRELVVQELRIVDQTKTTRASLGWNSVSDEATLKMYGPDGPGLARIELGTADAYSELSLNPASTAAGLRIQVGEEDVMMGLRYEPASGPSSRLELGVHRDLVQLGASAGLSTWTTSVANDRVALHLARSAEGFHAADLELDALGPTLQLSTEKAGRARLHVPAGASVPEMLVAGNDGTTARLTPTAAKPVTPPSAPTPAPTPPR